MLSTCEVLTPFSSLFPKHFSFRSLRSLGGDIIEGFDSSFHPSSVSPQLLRAMPSCGIGFFYELIDSINSFLVI